MKYLILFALFIATAFASDFEVDTESQDCVWQCSLWDNAESMMKQRSEILLRMRQNPDDHLAKIDLAMLDYKLGSLFINTDSKKALHFLNEGLEYLVEMKNADQKETDLLRLGVLYGLWATKIPLEQAKFAMILSEMSTIAFESKKINRSDPFMALQKGKSYFWWRPDDGVLSLTRALDNLDMLTENSSLKKFVHEESLVWLVRCQLKLGNKAEAEEAYQRLLAIDARYSEQKGAVFEISNR